MSTVSRGRVVQAETAELVPALRWRVIASAVTEPGARVWLQSRSAVDATLVCETSADATQGTAEFSLEAGGQRLSLFSARVHVTREGALTHMDAFDAAGARLVAATFAHERVLYAVTAAWERLGVAGGRYENA